MSISFWVKAPHVRYESTEDDIFGTKIVLESDSGFAMIQAEEISSVVVLTEPKNALEFNYKNGDQRTYYEITEYDYNEILCWVTVNKLKYETDRE